MKARLVGVAPFVFVLLLPGGCLFGLFATALWLYRKQRDGIDAKKPLGRLKDGMLRVSGRWPPRLPGRQLR
jgi:hypothetical protein